VYDVVIGCVDPVVPRGANMTRTGDKAVITCRLTAQKWHIVCQGSVWYGKVDNCTTSKHLLTPLVKYITSLTVLLFVLIHTFKIHLLLSLVVVVLLFTPAAD